MWPERRRVGILGTFLRIEGASLIISVLKGSRNLLKMSHPQRSHFDLSPTVL